MTNRGVARSSVKRAERVRAEAERLAEVGAWNLVVRRSQEAVELALKGLMRFIGLEVPHLHDVGGMLKQSADRLPEEVTAELERVVAISRRLREEREISFYGDEQTGAAPEELYSREDANSALSDARFVVDLCRAQVERRVSAK